MRLRSAFACGVVALALCFGATPVHAAVFVVDSTGDQAAVAPTNDGVCDAQPGAAVVCTLRAAIQEANALAGADTINFAIGAGLVTIQPGSLLPTISSVVVIDGTTQPGYAGTPIVEIDGSLAGGGVHGLTLDAGSSSSTIRGLVVARFSGIGIRILSSNTVIAGNYIGVDPTGTLAGRGNNVGVYLQNGNANRIGGTVAGDPNLISGNTVDGIQIDSADATLVQGNIIGLNWNGTAALGNGSQGIVIFNAALNNMIGGTAAGARNVISGNGGIGVTMSVAGTTGNRVEGNFIGTNAAGTSGFGNFRGIDIGANASGNFVGGAGVGNRIAYNTNSGVTLDFNAGAGNLIRENEIFLNGTGLGIDLSDNGVTLNDPGDGDAGPNNLQNFPVLSAAMTNGAGSANFAGSLNSAPSTAYRIEFFASTAADPSGFGEGQRYLGFTSVTTNAAGNAVIGATLATSMTAGELVAATATDPSNNTSEFSATLVAVGSLVVTTTADTTDGTTTSVASLIAAPGADGRISLREAILATNATAGTDTIRFGIPLTDANHRYYRNDAVASSLTNVQVTALADSAIADFDPDYPPSLARSWYRIQPSAALPTLTDAVILDGSTQPSFLVGGPVIELDGALAGFVHGLTVSGAASTIRGLVINGFGASAIRILTSSSSNVIACNYLGTDPSGTLARGNQVGLFLQAGGNQIGGTTQAERNVISGNTADGIQITGAGATGNFVQGNYIGLDVTGTAALGNASQGVAIFSSAANNTIGGIAAGAVNVISGNGNVGILIASAGTTGNRVEGNFIGTNAAGVVAIGNSSTGVAISGGATNTTIGGTVASARNIVAFNGLDGVAVVGAGVTNHSIVGNSIFSNGGLGVDLNDDGVSGNDVLDADTGPNDLLNFPVTTSVVESGGILTVDFVLDVPAGSYRIEFYKNPSGMDPSGYGEGRVFAGSTNVTHPGGGSVSFNHSFAGAVGDVIAATATVCTDGAICATFGNTSELNNAMTAVGSVTISSAVNQSFTVGGPSTAMAAVDIFDGSGEITASNDIRIRIPLGYPMRWDPTATTATLGGTAAAKVAPQVKAFGDSGRTVVLDATSDFVPGDQLSLSGLKFFSFTAPAGAANLELETENDGLTTAFDDKTIAILPGFFPTLSSDDDQAFVTGQPPVLMVPLTVSEGTTPSTTAVNDIRVRIPSSFNMTWDPTVTSAWILGPAATKVSSTVTYEDSDRTLVIDVLTPFVTSDFITVSALFFRGFSALSPPSNLELEVDNAGSVIDLDDKTIRIDLASDVSVFTATATDMQVKLAWVYPAGTCNFVRIVRDTAGFPGALDPTLISDVPCGAAGTKDSIVDSPLGNGTTYFYSAYVDHGSGYTAGKFVKARPFDTPVSIHWAYSTGATSMAPPGLRFQLPDSFLYAVSNDSILHSMRGGALGGEWPATWKPYKLGGPAQARPPVVSFSVGGGNGAAFVGSQDGRVYAVDSVNGTLKWDEPIASMVQAAPAGHFRAFNPAAFDLVLVGTRNSLSTNSFTALDVHTGNPIWSFINSVGQGGDGTAVGIISGGAVIDYPNNRAYFASRIHPSGSTHTLWCVAFNGASVARLWSQPLGNIDGSPILMNGRVYVGTNTGVVHALNAVTGAVQWSLPLGDGPIKGFPFPRGTNELFLSTNTKVWSVVDNVSSGSIRLGWPVTTIASPSIPLYIPGTMEVLVGSGDGKLYQMNVVTPLPAKSVMLGDGSAAVGAPTMDLLHMLIYVGTDAGVVYAVTFPLP